MKFFQGYKPDWLKHLFAKKPKQTTWVFCPECKNDMVSNNSCYEDSDLVYYECKVCGNKSEWNFDIAPVAILIRSDNGKTDLNRPKAINRLNNPNEA